MISRIIQQLSTDTDMTEILYRLADAVVILCYTFLDRSNTKYIMQMRRLPVPTIVVLTAHVCTHYEHLIYYNVYVI